MVVADTVGADAFESLSVLHTALLGLKQEPPRLFNAPRLVLDIAAGAAPGAEQCTRAELRCAKGDRDAFARFAAALDKTRERAIYMRRAARAEEDEEALRACPFRCPARPTRRADPAPQRRTAGTCPRRRPRGRERRRAREPDPRLQGAPLRVSAARPGGGWAPCRGGVKVPREGVCPRGFSLFSFPLTFTNEGVL